MVKRPPKDKSALPQENAQPPAAAHQTGKLPPLDIRYLGNVGQPDKGDDLEHRDKHEFPNGAVYTGRRNA